MIDLYGNRCHNFNNIVVNAIESNNGKKITVESNVNDKFGKQIWSNMDFQHLFKFLYLNVIMKKFFQLDRTKHVIQLIFAN